jgi:hypothetical protein
MFISYAEKKFLQSELKGAFQLISALSTDITMLKAKIKVLEAKQTDTKKPKKPMTAAQKAKQRQYQKAYNDRQKAKKLAEQGKTNVSP